LPAGKGEVRIFEIVFRNKLLERFELKYSSNKITLAVMISGAISLNTALRPTSATW
jgi:hypothetical protein